jgi:hypothetical protein
VLTVVSELPGSACGAAGVFAVPWSEPPACAGFVFRDPAYPDINIRTTTMPINNIRILLFIADHPFAWYNIFS